MYQVSSQQGIHRVLGLLGELDRWIDEVPPLPTPQRFGNLAFRKWGERLEQVFPSVTLFDISTT
jgi:serine/threonine-protein phosphatase 2A activator